MKDLGLAGNEARGEGTGMDGGLFCEESGGVAKKKAKDIFLVVA